MDSENIVGYSVAYPPLLARSFPLVKFSDSVRSSFSSPDVVDLGERGREKEQRGRDGRTGGRPNNASTKGETMLADSTSKLQKMANWGQMVTYLLYYISRVTK